MIIAIDGPAATGKSTTAIAVAEELGFTYLDTGAMYRAVTFSVIDRGISLDDKDSLKIFLNMLDINMYFDDKVFKVEINDRDVTGKIRDPEITSRVSEVSAVQEIRKAMVNLQRQMVVGKNCVVEGRDIGTVVFPEADLKFFMVADVRVRAERRQKDLLVIGKNKNIGELEVDIKKRDNKDSSRTHSPLLKSDDAIIIDTSNLEFEEQVNLIIELTKNYKKEMT
ncbi:MAG: cytidylate kinase [Candidatus Marinimicrobia bacterium]|nr:cytidylate kinase [Candidatus Neomarinimicrobiota bacterium]|tara:strand:+ start:1680 stop:2351 length:672 start_codon:yes stop_codon:yes gene_type:complete